MITTLKIRNNSVYLYLTQAIIQLMHIDTNNANFLFTLKNKILYITKASQEQINSPYVTNIRKIGSGWGIYMNRTILEFIEVNAESDNIEIDIDNETLILKKAEL